MSYEIACTRCKAPVAHECQRFEDGVDEDGNVKWKSTHFGTRYHTNPLAHAFVELLMWKPEGGFPDRVIEAMKGSDWYDEGDENAPFFSQAVTYPLLDWKDNGRVLDALFNAMMRAAGFDPYAIRRLAHKAERFEDKQSAVTRGGLLGLTEMEGVDWLPEEGFKVGLTAEGVGVITVFVEKVVVNERGDNGPRGDWDLWVYFAGGGRCHFRRLLRIAHWVKDHEGEKVWPPAEQEVTDGK
jgi:hypothetical protein